MTRSTILLASLVFLTGILHAENTKLSELRIQGFILAEEIYKVVEDPHSADPELGRLHKERIEAKRAYEEAVETDPNLKKINEEFDASTVKYKEATKEYGEVMKDNMVSVERFERWKAATEQHMAVYSRRTEAIENQPGLRALVAAHRKANDAYITRYREFFLNHPANKGKVAQLNKIDAEIEKLETESTR